MPAATSFMPWNVQFGRAILLPGLLFLLGNAWAAQYITSKFLGDAGVDPVSALFDVHALLVMIFAVWLYATGRLFRPSLRQAIFFVIAALIGNVMSLLAQLSSAPHLPASMMAIIGALAPAFTIAFALMLRCEAVSIRSLLAIALGLSAAAMITLPGVEIGGNTFWILIAFIGPAGFAGMGILMSARWPEDLDPLQVAFGIAVAGTVLLFPLAAGAGPAWAVTGEVGVSDLALVVFALTLVFEYWAFACLTRLGGAIYASCADFVATGTGLFWAWVFFAEVPTPWMWAAASLSVATLFIIKQTDSRTTPGDESRSPPPQAAASKRFSS